MYFFIRNQWIVTICFLGLLVFIPGTVYSAIKSQPIVSKGLEEKIIKILENKCMACHTQDPNLPFYAEIPGIKQIIEKDFKDGLRAENLDEDVVMVLKQGKTVDASSIAKLEWVVLNSTMPPGKFTAIHWSSRLTEQDKKDILNWVKAYRAAYHSTGLAAPNRANEPLQPLPDKISYDPKKAALGEKLFNDKRLSLDDTVRCLSCHKLDQGGADDIPLSKGVGDARGVIKAPTVYNAAYNIRQFWDGRASDLQDQASGPILNPLEMASKSIDDVIAKLAKDKEFTAEFTAVYPNGWTKENLTDAIAEFEKTLLTPNSRFDQWLKGNDKVLTADEIRGYELFKAYRCVTCHVGPSMGGQSFEYMDLKKDYFADRGTPLTDADKGLENFTHNPNDNHKFKVPNLRVVVFTKPYLHDGTQVTLDDTVRIMGTYVVGMDIPPGDCEKIVKFLRSVVGEYNGEPLKGIQVEK